MEMTSSEVEMSSCQTFNCVLNPHERCNSNNHNKKNKNKNNVRNIHVAFEKNLNVFVRDPLQTSTIISGDDSTKSVPECSSTNKSSVSDHRLLKTEESQAPMSSPSLGSDPDQIENPSKKETRAASSLVQIWEARTTQQPPNQSQIDSRTSSSGTNPLDNSESLNEETELIQPIEEGNNNEEEVECVPPSPQDSVRVMDIIRKLSNDSETMPNNENGSGSGSYDNSKDVQITEARYFPQVACSPRIRGRQAFADLLDRMIRDREKELACLLESHCVTKFTYRGRIQSTLRIRCYERCIAIQSRHRCKPSLAGSDLNRSPRGSGVMNLLREKHNTGAASSSMSSRGRVFDKDPHKATEKKVLQETMEKSDLKEIQEVNSATEIVKKAVFTDTSDTKSGLKKSAGETMQKEKVVVKEILEGRGEILTKEKAIAKETIKGKGEKLETKEIPVSRENVEGRGEKRELTKEKGIAKENVEGNIVMDKSKGSSIAEKVNLWNSEDKSNKRTGVEKGKSEGKGTTTDRVEKKEVVEDATRRIIDVEIAERSITTTSREAFGEKVVRRKKQEDYVSVETKSKEVEDRNINPQEFTTKVDSSFGKPDAVEKDSREITAKSDVKKPIEKESREERRETEESVERNSMMGIAEKVNMWNSKEKKNRRRVMEKGKGKTEGKSNTETNEVLKEAARRISNVETAERCITTSKGTSEKVEATRCESEEKGRRKKDEDASCVEGKSKVIIEDKNMNSQEATLPQVSASHGSRDITKGKNSSQHGEEMTRLRNSEDKSIDKSIDRNNSQEATSTSDASREKAKEKVSLQQPKDMSFMQISSDEIKMVEHEENAKAAIEYISDCDENQLEEEDIDDDEYGEYDHYYGENMSDWIYDISRPRSYWEDLRKERYLEVLNTESDKNGICDLIYSRTVSNFLTSDLRQKIDNLMISRVQGHLGVQINQQEEEYEDEKEEEEEGWEDECLARNLEDNETEEEPEKAILEAVSDVCSQSSSWSFKDQEISNDHEPTTSLSIPEPSTPATQSTQEMQMISDLRGQMEQLQREMLELRNTVKSCMDMQLHFQKSVTQDLSRSSSSAEQQVDTKNDPLKRKCCVCSEMPVDSLLYRCGHMCTCLKCAHELQWSSKKCPICMAPIVDVVRAFLDS